MKNWLIKLLGGYTEDELWAEFTRGIHQGVDQEKNPRMYFSTAIPETVVAPIGISIKLKPKKKKK